jgi:hypothetical protein
MIACTTVRPGVDCLFMAASGCSFEGGTCNQLDEQCEGCANVVEYKAGKFCNVYAEPSAQWEQGICAFATHQRYVPSAKGAISTNPLKASKRAAGRK